MEIFGEICRLEGGAGGCEPGGCCWWGNRYSMVVRTWARFGELALVMRLRPFRWWHSSSYARSGTVRTEGDGEIGSDGGASQSSKRASLPLVERCRFGVGHSTLQFGRATLANERLTRSGRLISYTRRKRNATAVGIVLPPPFSATSPFQRRLVESFCCAFVVVFLPSFAMTATCCAQISFFVIILLRRQRRMPPSPPLLLCKTRFPTSYRGSTP